jgi:hypothetical protein
MLDHSGGFVDKSAASAGGRQVLEVLKAPGAKWLINQGG